jgi:hypothetical protein
MNKDQLFNALKHNLNVNAATLVRKPIFKEYYERVDRIGRDSPFKRGSGEGVVSSSDYEPAYPQRQRQRQSRVKTEFNDEYVFATEALDG